MHKSIFAVVRLLHTKREPARCQKINSRWRHGPAKERADGKAGRGGRRPALVAGG